MNKWDFEIWISVLAGKSCSEDWLTYRHREILAGNPDINLEDVNTKSKYMRDFDENFTRKIYRFDSVEDYYTEASSATRIHSEFYNFVDRQYIFLSHLIIYD